MSCTQTRDQKSPAKTCPLYDTTGIISENGEHSQLLASPFHTGIEIGDRQRAVPGVLSPFSEAAAEDPSVSDPSSMFSSGLCRVSWTGTESVDGRDPSPSSRDGPCGKTKGKPPAPVLEASVQDQYLGRTVVIDDLPGHRETFPSNAYVRSKKYNNIVEYEPVSVHKADVKNLKRLSTTSASKSKKAGQLAATPNCACEWSHLGVSKPCISSCEVIQLPAPSNPGTEEGTLPLTSPRNRSGEAPDAQEIIVTYKNQEDDDIGVANNEESSGLQGAEAIEGSPTSSEAPFAGIPNDTIKDPNMMLKEPKTKASCNESWDKNPMKYAKVRTDMSKGKDRLFPFPSAPARMFKEEDDMGPRSGTVGIFFAGVATNGAKSRQKSPQGNAETNDELITADYSRSPGAGAERSDGKCNSHSLITNNYVGSQLLDDDPGSDVVFKRDLCLYPIAFLLCIGIMVIVLASLFPAPQHGAGRQFLDLMINSSLARPREHRRSNTCINSTCSQNAAFLDNLLSWNVDPCEDLYEFVCTRWTSQYSAVEQTTGKVTFDEDYNSQVEARMYTVLQHGSKGSSLLHPLRHLFRECVVTKSLEASGWDPLLRLLSLVSLQGFPFTPPVRSNASVWKIAAKILKATGAAVLLNLDVVAHPISTTRDIVIVDVPDTIVGSNGGDMNKTVHSYHTIVETSLKILQKEFIPPVHTAQIVSFATELERLSVKKGTGGQSTVHRLSAYTELSAYFAEIFDGVPSSAYSGNNSDFILRSPEFFSALFPLVRKTEAHTVMNFLSVRLIVQVSAFVPQTELLDIYAALLYRKPTSSIPRWKLCVRVVDNTFPHLFLLAILLDVHIETVTKDIFSLAKAIVHEVIKGLDQVAFLDDETKAAAKHIVATTQYRVLGPSWIGNKTAVLSYIRKIPEVPRGQGLMSYAALHHHVFSARLTQDSSSRWASSAFSTDCWTDGSSRAIYAPALLFNISLSAVTVQTSLPFQLPRAGVRLARCIFGMLLEDTRPELWMSETSRGRINETLRCVGVQYGSGAAAPMPRLEYSVAIRLMFKHFVRTVQGLEYTTKLHLPRSKDLSPEQLFFVYLVLQSCEKPAVGEVIDNGSGALANFLLQNEPMFQKAFECSSSTPMNPPHKCLLWESS